MGKTLKCGIVGFGYMGEIRRTVIEPNSDLDLVGICDTNPIIRGKVNGCKTFNSFEKLLKEDIDIVFVCTPNTFSPEICIASMKAGKHVFCEKPPGRCTNDIRNIMAGEQDASVKLMFGFNHRYHPGIIKSKVIVDSGQFGKIIGMRGIYGKSGGVSFPKSWRNDKAVSGGGILLDQGIHMLDLFRHFCGDFEQIKCFLGNSFWKFDIEDNAYVILQNGKGQNALCHSSATFWRHTFRLDIMLEGGYLIVEGFLSKTGSYGREKLIVSKRQFEDETQAVGNPSEEVTYFDRDLSWNLEVEEFLRCIKENKKVTMSSSQDALKVMEIIEKAYKDAGTHLVPRELNEVHSHF